MLDSDIRKHFAGTDEGVIPCQLLHLLSAPALGVSLILSICSDSILVQSSEFFSSARIYLENGIYLFAFIRSFFIEQKIFPGLIDLFVCWVYLH